MIAIDKMGKNKAAAADELLDVIFQVREWKLLERKIKEKGEEREEWKKELYDSKKEEQVGKE